MQQWQKKTLPETVPAPCRNAPDPLPQCLRFLVKGRIDVAGTVQHADDIDAVLDRRVKDDVPPERKTAQISGQLADDN